MRAIKDQNTPAPATIGRGLGLRQPILRQVLLAGVAVGLAACGGPAKEVGTVGAVSGFAGMVAADEPRAALVAEEVLSAGGNAVDAAVALYFTMAVTKPSAASLGGGGSCVVFNQPKKQVEALDFVARASSVAGGDRPTAVPGNPRGFYALHAKHGRLRWEQLLGPAEQLARLGTPVSRSFAYDIAQVARALYQDPGVQQIFVKERRSVTEGDVVPQLDLATMLSRLRLNGPGDFYSGATARLLVESYKAAGGSLSLDDLRNFAPQWVTPLAVSYGNDIAYFPPPPAVGGVVAAQMFGMLADKDRFEDADAELRNHLLAEAGQRAFAERARWMQPGGGSTEAPANLVSAAKLRDLAASIDPATHKQAPGASAPAGDVLGNTGFVVADREGSAVACTVGSNGIFGIGRVAPGTGIIMAATPQHPGAGSYAFAPMVAINKSSNELRFAAASEGGPTAPTALVQVAAQTLLAERPLSEAVAAPRLHHGAVPEAAVIEKIEAADATAAGLEKRGHRVGRSPMPSRVNALVCRSGNPNAAKCQAATDPRGFGYAMTVGQ